MEMFLRRRWFTDLSTIGELEVDGHSSGFVLEDKMREIPGAPVEQWKVKGRTAIPVGRYKVIIAWSNRFKRMLPRLLDVPGFQGILIHSGNTAGDTEGCLLVGMARAADKVIDSRRAFNYLFDDLSSATGDIWITVTNEGKK